MRRKFWPSFDGSTTAAWGALIDVMPDLVTDLVNSICCDADALATIVVGARAYGKGTHTPTLSAIRAILPLPPIAQILDLLLSFEMETIYHGTFSLPQELYFGSAPGTQITDVISGSAMFLSKGMDDGADSGAEFTIAQSDIQQFYDRISPIDVGRWLLSRGHSPWIVASATLLMLAPSVTIHAAGSMAKMAQRVTGSLTGSRVAGWLGRVITARVCQQLLVEPTYVPCKLGNRAVSLSLWIDNVFSMDRSPHAAIHRLQLFESLLTRIWGLSIKPSSRQWISTKGNRTSFVMPGWQQVCPMIVLGSHIWSDGRATCDIAVATQKAWSRFWIGPGSKKNRLLPIRTKALDFLRTVWPGIGSRCSWWSLNEQIWLKLNRTQRQMIAILLRPKVRPDETIKDYCRRRHLLAANSSKKNGLFGDRAIMRTISWEEHMVRAHHHSWATSVRLWRPDLWLRAMRVLARSSSDTAGKLNLRERSGRPSTRWEEGIRWSNARSQESTFTVSNVVRIKDHTARANRDKARERLFQVTQLARQKLRNLISYIMNIPSSSSQ